MPASFASCIERIEPDRVSLSVRRQARVRVVGSALGFVRCGDERRWVWGRFDETFVIKDLGKARPSLSVRVWGLGGGAARDVPTETQFDLTPPSARLRLKRLSLYTPAAPRLHPLHIEQPPSSEDDP